MKSNLVKRSLTGALVVLIIVSAIVVDPLYYAAVFSIITGMTIWEFCQMLNTNSHTRINNYICTIAGVYLFLATFFYHTYPQTEALGEFIFVPYILTMVILLVSEIYSDSENTVNNLAYAMMSQIYVALPFACFNFLAYNTIGAEGKIETVHIFQLAVFFFLWASDTGAYCCGSLFGKNRLFPSISPKKTWEGTIGGGIVALAVSQVLAVFFPIGVGNFNLFHNHVTWAGLALFVVAFGTWGDLVESRIKRRLLIKDSGNILPGHGGMLDRFDSALLAIPAATGYLYIINSIFDVF